MKLTELTLSFSVTKDPVPRPIERWLNGSNTWSSNYYNFSMLFRHIIRGDCLMLRKCVNYRFRRVDHGMTALSVDFHNGDHLWMLQRSPLYGKCVAVK